MRNILEAAARILKRDGLAKLTTNHIADQAGVSVGSVYQYFPNKQAILVQLMTAQLEHAMATRPTEMDSEVSLESHIAAAVGWHLALRRDDPLLFQRLFEVHNKPCSAMTSGPHSNAFTRSLCCGACSAMRQAFRRQT